MYDYSDYYTSLEATRDVRSTNDEIQQSLSENEGVIDSKITKLYEKRLMQGLWLQYR